MPPFVPRKRHRSPGPNEDAKPTPPLPPSAKKPSLFDTLEARPKHGRTIEDNKAFLSTLDDDSSDSSLSDVGSSEFEDVDVATPPKRRRLEHAESDNEDEEIDWEDAIPGEASTTTAAAAAATTAPPLGDLELTLDKTARVSLTNPHGTKKGPSKIERQIRIQTHCMHVQFLLFHNLVRNVWICDEEVQRILVGKLPEAILKEVERWRVDSGLPDKGEESTLRGKKGKGKKDRAKDKAQARNARDWGEQAERLEPGVVNLSQGDPLFRLLRVLSSFWKKRFRITAPGLRKQGYKPLATLEDEVKSFHNDPHDPLQHGEKIRDLKDFRGCAKRCEGSRDVGSLLHTALLRGLGLEARLVASLQPIGFGWGKGETAVAKKKDKKNTTKAKGEEDLSKDGDGPSSNAVKSSAHRSKTKLPPSTTPKTAVKKTSTRGTRQTQPIDLSSSPEPEDAMVEDDDEMSVVEVTPKSRSSRESTFDKDLPYPIYWTEVLSPVTNRFVPVDPLVLRTIATNEDLLGSFEPRSAAADKAKQVVAYIVAFSSDGTAKDVTVRYLKRHMWPGKTKGVRMPVEKVPIYNRRGKIKRYEEYDWFKSIMSSYARDAKQRTPVDDYEDEHDLKPIKLVREAKQGEETLQSYKSSADFVLERHLRREEALVPGAKHVKMSNIGKGDKAIQEKVFRRADVVACKTSESWHKEGREVKAGQHPMKLVPMRAMTLNRKREIEQVEADSGEKMMQGLYARDQTDWIIPPPITNGIIPRNAFGNIDCYVPSMVPKGAVHLPFRSTAKICKRLNISFAEAVVGFEFKSQRAVPLVQGVVVPEENEDMVMEEWQHDEEERRKKEEGKREKMALALWRKFLMGMRILARVRDEYGGDANGHVADELNPFTNRSKGKLAQQKAESTVPEMSGRPDGEEDDALAGGFLHDGDDEADVEGGGFFPLGHTEEEIEDAKDLNSEKGLEQGRTKLKINSYPQTPISSSSLTPRADELMAGTSSSEDDLKDSSAPMTHATKRKIPTRQLLGRTTNGTEALTPQSMQQESRRPTPPKKARQTSRHTKVLAKEADGDSDSSDVGNESGYVGSDVESKAGMPRKNTRKRHSNRIVDQAMQDSSNREVATRKARPKRQSARKSETTTRSHYFELDHEDGDESAAVENEPAVSVFPANKRAKKTAQSGARKGGKHRAGRKTS